MAKEELPERTTDASAVDGPVVLDGIVSDEKLAELLAFQTEYPALDFKATIELTQPGTVELAKDIGAMQVRGGYIIGGVDGKGVPTGDMDGTDHDKFDEARLRPKLLKYLPEPLELRTNVITVSGHKVVLIYVGRNPAGCAIFKADGTYTKNGREKVVFRQGDVFWRDGTQSTRLTQHGFEDIIRRRIEAEKGAWLAEHQEIRRREQADVESSYESRRLAEAPLGTVSFDLPAKELSATALEMLRAKDEIGLRRLLADGLAGARAAIDSGSAGPELGDVLDKLACLAATFLAYEQREWLDRVIGTLREIYSMPLAEHDAQRLGYATHINPQENGPRVWLAVIERVFALGALAVRRRDWQSVRALTLQKPDRLGDYERNWLRHALTMASRAQHLEKTEDGQTIKLSLLSLARSQVERLGCLRPDGIAGDDEAIITSLAQFDVLSNITAIDGAGSSENRVFYPNFARFRQTRIQPVVEQLLSDKAMRAILFRGSDDQLASGLHRIGEVAHHEGFFADGFDGWAHTPVGAFIEKNQPPPGDSET